MAVRCNGYLGHLTPSMFIYAAGNSDPRLSIASVLCSRVQLSGNRMWGACFGASWSGRARRSASALLPRPVPLFLWRWLSFSRSRSVSAFSSSRPSHFVSPSVSFSTTVRHNASESLTAFDKSCSCSSVVITLLSTAMTRSLRSVNNGVPSFPHGIVDSPSWTNQHQPPHKQHPVVYLKEQRPHKRTLVVPNSDGDYFGHLVQITVRHRYNEKRW